MDLFQAGVVIDMPELHMYISPTRNMHLYVVIKKCQKIMVLFNSLQVVFQLVMLG